MKKILLIAFVLTLVFAGASIATAADVTLAWDANDPAPEGYRIFMRLDGEQYDYLNPEWTGTGTTVTISEIPEPVLGPIQQVSNFTAVFSRITDTIEFNWTDPVIDGGSLTYYFVARAYEGAYESGDSNEVDLTLGADRSLSHSIIYYSESADGPWTQLAQIDSGTTLTDPFTYVQAGENKQIYFALVTFATDGAFSANVIAQEMINRQPPAPPGQLRKVTTPVQ